MGWDLQQVGYGIGTLVTGLALGFLAWRRKYSSVNLGVDRDTATSDLITKLSEERDRYEAAAREAWANHIEDSKKISCVEAENKRLTHEVANCQMQIKILGDTVNRLKRTIAKLDPQSAHYLGSDYGVLSDTSPKDDPR
jgi:chromosome segregation ATPase